MTLRVEDLAKSYGHTRALDGVTLQAQDGEILGICGENGAGKSTLMKILAGALPDGEYGGRVLLDGTVLQLRGPRDAERTGIALLPQELSHYPDLSVAENVMSGHIPAQWGMVHRRALHEQARRRCEHVGLDTDVARPIRRLSTPERQLVAIARALGNDPRILMLDEPTAALPRAATDRLFSILRAARQAGRTILYISHHLDDIMQIADRVTVLRNGQVTLQPTKPPGIDTIVHAMVGSDSRAQVRRSTGVPDTAPMRFSAHIRSLQRGPDQVLRDIEVRVRAGEILGVTGLLGSGVADLLTCLAGAPRGHVDGDVVVDSQRIKHLSPKRLRRAGVSFVPDDRHADGLLPLGNLIQNITLGSESDGAFFGIRRPAGQRLAVQRHLEQHAVQPADPDVIASKLSGGNQQKALLARARFSAPAVFVLTDPTRGVDVVSRRTIYRVIRQAADSGAAVVLGSTDSGELIELCDRILVLWRGQTSAHLDTAHLTEAELVAATNQPPEHTARAT